MEEKKKKEVEKLQRRLQLSKMSHLERERVWAEEMKEGIGESATGEDKVGKPAEGEEKEGCVGRRPIRAEERKTKKQRRKELMRKKTVRLTLVLCDVCDVIVWCAGAAKEITKVQEDTNG